MSDINIEQRPDPDKKPKHLQFPLNFFLYFGRLPLFNRGILRRMWLAILQRYVKHPLKQKFLGIPFIFHLDNPTERKAIFGYYNIRELSFLKKAITNRNSVFLDIGANSGLYTQYCLAKAGREVRVIAIEPNPEMVRRIQQNAALIADIAQQKSHELHVEMVAVGGSEAMVGLDLSYGPGAASIKARVDGPTIRVPMQSLYSIVKKHSLEKIDCLKIDIEGFEDQALLPFFKSVDPELYPHAIIIEHTSTVEWREDLWSFLLSQGYQEVGRTRGNALLIRSLSNDERAI